MAPNIPINLKLRSKADRDVALAQDIIIMELYKFFPEAVLHGGTGIWRCHHGNRFSEDVDVYINNDAQMLDNFFKSLMTKGFKINKRRLKENSVYSGLSFNNIQTKFEASFQKKKYISMNYEASDGFFIRVLTALSTTTDVSITNLASSIRYLFFIYLFKCFLYNLDIR